MRVKRLPCREVHALKDIFERRRSLTVALLAKEVISQIRNLLFWGRIAILLVLLSLFPLVRTVATRYGVGDNVLVMAYSAGLVIFHIIETAPGAISGEANRLAFYLTASCTLSHLLRAKLSLLLLPVLIEVLAIALVLCWRTGLMAGQVAFVVSADVLIVVGCTTLLIWGSAWDEDLNLAVEGAVETFVQEEVPVTPRKMGLFNACLLLFVGMCLLLWKLPLAAEIVLLILLDAIILAGMWHLSISLTRGLLRKE